jgi:hypothetical protein
VESKEIAPSPEEALLFQNPSKYYSMPPVPMLENLQKNTFKVEYTSTKRIHTTLVIFFKKNYERIFHEVLVIPSSSASQIKYTRTNPKLQSRATK